MKGYRISLIRHGRTEANDKGIYIGRTDYPLSQKGISELYNKLDEFEYPHVGKVYMNITRGNPHDILIQFYKRQCRAKAFFLP